MPYNKPKKRKCRKADGSSGSWVVDKDLPSGKTEQSSCHDSEDKASASIRARKANEVDVLYGEEINEDIARILVKEVLLEQVFGVKGIKTNKAARERISGIASSLFPGDEIGNVTIDSAHVRIHTSTLFKADDSEQSSAAKSIVSNLTRVPKSQISVQVGSDDEISGKYRFRKLSWQDDLGNQQSLKIIFAGKAGSGQRGGGYKYEEDIVKKFSKCVSGICYQNTDTTGVDVMLELPSGHEVHIEAKLLSAKFGQPTLVYNFATPRGFAPSTDSRSLENAKLTSGLLNSAKARRMLSRWMDDVRQAYFLSMKNQGATRPVMTQFGTQVSPKTYGTEIPPTGMWEHPTFKQSVSKIPASPEYIIGYYKKKGAHYIQIESKGLYQIGESNPIGFGTGILPAIPNFKKALEDIPVSVTAEIMTSGGNKVLRGTGIIKMKQLVPSNVSLDDMEMVRKIVDHIVSPASGPASFGSDSPSRISMPPIENVFRSENLLNENNLSLIVEELTGADKSDIKRMIAKEIDGAANKKATRKIFLAEFDREFKKMIDSKSVKDSIRSEVESTFKDKATKKEIAEVTKAVIKKLYRELSYSSVHIVDRIKV